MSKKKIRTLDQLKDAYLGKPGTKTREQYELELSMDFIGQLIREIRINKNLTQ